MSKRLRKHAALLRTLAKAKSKTRQKLLKEHCDEDFICCMTECARNLLKGNVPLNPAQMKKLSTKRRMIRELALKKTSLKKKRKLIQSGGFIGALLGPIVSVLSSIFSK